MHSSTITKVIDEMRDPTFIRSESVILFLDSPIPE